MLRGCLLPLQPILSAGMLPAPEPAGMTLVGAADFDPEWQAFGTPEPTARIPVGEAMAGQLTNGETLPLSYFDGGVWKDSGRSGTVGAMFADGKAVSGTIGTLHAYAVFLADQDGDGRRDERDCAPADTGAFAAPGEVSGARLLPDEATIEWDSLAWSAGSGTVYDVLRGVIGQWPVGSGGGEFCRESGSADARASDATTPGAGTGYYYVVRGRNACATGSYGRTRNGIERTSTACP